MKKNTLIVTIVATLKAQYINIPTVLYKKCNIAFGKKGSNRVTTLK